MAVFLVAVFFTGAFFAARVFGRSWAVASPTAPAAFFADSVDAVNAAIRSTTFLASSGAAPSTGFGRRCSALAVSISSSAYDAGSDRSAGLRP
ncbi:hypothetical protein ABZ734_11590 [Streptomyces sp. NPDC006660]|uniref:hypothetical protein n=1 Tax=Streptomyces sp. NPDC006660 TaxID=3156901 RepID=UPI0033F1A9FA